MALAPKPFSSTAADLLASVDRVVWHYGDASVPPPHHRSYSITVTRSEVYCVVDSYVDHIAKSRRKLDSAPIPALMAVFRSAGINEGPAWQGDQPTGCTSRSIQLFIADRAVFSAGALVSGDQLIGRLQGDVSAFAAAMEHLVPELATLLLA
jgi:hypothetical protein